MRVKLLMPGMQYFNGMMGAVKFNNGISEEMTLREANALCASMRAEIIEGDESLIANRSYEMNKSTPAPVKAKQVAEIAETATKLNEVLSSPVYTEEQLGKIADTQGIAGLRKIGEEFGIRDKSIKGLIDGIVEAQRPKK